MISRRLIRIKTMQTYYAFSQSPSEIDINGIQKELERSLNESYHLFLSLHCLLVSIFDFARDRMEIALNKHLATYEDLNPNKKFIDNQIISSIIKNRQIEAALRNQQLSWRENTEFLKTVWSSIVNSDYYKNYMLSTNSSFKEDRDIITNIINNTLLNNDDLDDILEDKSIYWNDDLEFLLSNIIQNLKRYNEHTILNYMLPPLYKDEEDKTFAIHLLKKTILHYNEYDELILSILKKWELDRIAFLDRVIIHLALTEIMYIPDMPVKVTINEYLDLAKCYSTDKSNIFVNGILDKIYKDLQLTGRLNKTGLGLVE